MESPVSVFEKFWQSIESEIEDVDVFSDTVQLILEILKSDYSVDFDRFFDKSGNVKSFKELCKLKKINFSFDPKLSTWQIIHNLLAVSQNEGKAGYVAQHLVGAKLELRFPDYLISNESVSTADKPTNRSGDFSIGNAVFHITVSPMQAVFEKCQQNLLEGLKVFLIVPDAKLAGARQLADQFCNGQIAVESLESFVSQNIEELSTFNFKILEYSLVSLINIYNKRVDAVETDKSLMIELPSNLENIHG